MKLRCEEDAVVADHEGAVQVDVRGHHFAPSEELLTYAREHAEKLGRYFGGLRRLELILKQDGRAGFQAELVAHVVRGKQLAAEGGSAEAMTVAIDSAVDRMERQLVRFKERLRDRRSHGG
jgi:putative sigma-54 modulation protein